MSLLRQTYLRFRRDEHCSSGTAGAFSPLSKVSGLFYARHSADDQWSSLRKQAFALHLIGIYQNGCGTSASAVPYKTRVL